jgi:hypothetical protein
LEDFRLALEVLIDAADADTGPLGDPDGRGGGVVDGSARPEQPLPV